MDFEHFEPAAFLRDHWQRKPLLIRNPWKAWDNPLEPDELAGMACESDVESRLIVCSGDSWSLEHGPVPEARFGQLGAMPWTLLVQAVDQHIPDVAALIEPFRFIPNWRIDDVMVSYASDGGGVGPHFDQYDVFLVQGLGRRRWQVGAPCDEAARLLPHDDLRLLEHFEATDEWVLEPGDILYVPPRVPHNGVAIGDDCMTYSIGFRAPSRRELVAGWCDNLLSSIGGDDRYADPHLALQDNPGEISAQALVGLHSLVAEKLADRDAFAAWVGRYLSTPRYPEMDWTPDVKISLAATRVAIAQGRALLRNPASRFCFISQQPEAILLFVDGQMLACGADTRELAQRLCGEDRIHVDPTITDATLALVRTLCNQGSIAFEPED